MLFEALKMGGGPIFFGGGERRTGLDLLDDLIIGSNQAEKSVKDPRSY